MPDIWACFLKKFTGPREFLLGKNRLRGPVTFREDWYIPTKFEDNLASDFGEEDENVIVNSEQTPDRTTDDDPSYKLSLYTTAELKLNQ